jgi:hypothetical protein
MALSRRNFLAVSAIGAVRLPSDLFGDTYDPPRLSAVAPTFESQNSSAFIGPPLLKDEWTSGWTSAKPFSVGSKKYLFLLKSGNGLVRIHEFISNGRLSPCKHQYDWSSGWISASFYEVGGSTYLALLKTSGLSAAGHRAHFHQLNLDGSVNPNLIYAADWSAGWTHLVPIHTSQDTYLLLYRRQGIESGGVRAQVYRAQSNGSLDNNPVNQYRWNDGWTSIAPYVVRGKNYLILVRSGAALTDGTRMRVVPVGPDGKIAPAVQSSPWSGGYVRASIINAEGRTYILLYNQDGRVHVHAIQADGTVGSRVAWYSTKTREGMENGSLAWRDGPIPWSEGWTSIEPYEAPDGRAYLFLLKKGETATVQIHPIRPMKDVGPAVTHVASDTATVWMGLVGGNPALRSPLTFEYRETNGAAWQSVPALLKYPTSPPSDTNGPPQDYYAAAVGTVPVQPSRRYDYRVKSGSSMVGGGSFSSAPSPDSRSNFKMVVASCMDLGKSRGQPAWKHILAAKPAFVLLIGDTAYANTTDRSMQWAEHVQQRSVPSFADLISKVPTLIRPEKPRAQ